MSRQHATPVHLSNGDASQLVPLSFAGGDISEADIQALVHTHPSMLPVAEIDPAFANPVPICRELNTPAGPIDNFMVTAGGFPVLVECKLWRNPEGRREVVGQILDYAKELSRWSSADLQREVNVRLKHETGNPLFDIVRQAHPDLDEIEFNDALTLNLRRGRFLLLIVGDGIRAGVESIAEYIQAHAGLHFALGLVELPFYQMADGSRLVVPRVLAKTTNITRHVVEIPEGFAVAGEGAGEEADVDVEKSALQKERQGFWKAFLDQHLRLDDPEQRIPPPARQGYLSFMLPAPQGSSWLTVYRDKVKNEVGVMLSSSRNSAGEYAARAIASNWEAVRSELGGSVTLSGTEDRPKISEAFRVPNFDNPENRRQAYIWLADRVNTFVNVLRPLVRSAAADYQSNDG